MNNRIATALLFVGFLFTACDKSPSASKAVDAQKGKPAKPAATTQARTEAPLVTVYKSPTCSCCSRWVKHLEQNGFRVVAKDVKDVVPYKQKFGVTPELSSCHTAIVNGYVVEGHVPASDIRKMLKDKPAVTGISVPGMPVGSPGMEQGNLKEPYNVISFDKQGQKKVYSSH